MRKQLFKAATMFVGIIALAFASALAASAQNQRSLVVNIPFDFNVKGKTLPAGEYIFSRGSSADSSGLIIESKGSKANAIVLTMSIESRESQRQSRLVFNRYGEQYFLSQVWTVGDNHGRGLLKSKRERSMEIELAKADARPEVVAIAARLQ